MSSTVRVLVDSSVKTCDTLRLYLYIWLRDQNDMQSMWNVYICRLLNDARIKEYLESQHVVSNRLGDHLKLFGWVVSTIIAEKRLLSPLDVLALWRSFMGDDEQSMLHLTEDGKILLASTCDLLIKSKEKRTTFSYYEMQEAYDALKTKVVSAADVSMWWVEPSYDVNILFFFMVLVSLFFFNDDVYFTK